VNVRAFRDGGEHLIDELHAICVKIMRNALWPQIFADSNMAPIPKKAGAQDEGDHRGASVSAHASKIMTGILNDRIRAAVEKICGEYQFGFRRYRGTDDAVLALRKLMDRAHARGDELHVGYIDLVKAFDTVDWDFLFRIMGVMGFPDKIINVIRALYRQTRFRVKTKDGVSEWIEQECGVRQGCCLSSALFNIFLGHAMRIVEKGGAEGVKIPDMLIGLIGYADDLALVDLDLSRFRERVCEIANVMSSMGMEMSVKKTKVMMMGRKVKESLACEICGGTEGHDILVCGDVEGRYGCGKGRHMHCGLPVLFQAGGNVWGGEDS